MLNNNNNMLDYAHIALSPPPTHTLDELERFQREATSSLHAPLWTIHNCYAPLAAEPPSSHYTYLLSTS